MSKTENSPLQSKVSKATVYTDRAIITRTCEAKIKSGIQTLKVENLPADMDESSFRVAGFGLQGLTFLDVKTKKEFKSEVPDAEVRELKAQLEAIEVEMEALTDKVEVLDKKREFVESIKVFSAESISKDFERKRPEVKDWNQVLDFMGSSLTGLNEEGYALGKQEKELEEKKNEIEIKLSELMGAAQQWWKSAWIEVEASESGTVQLELSYQVNQAWWTPFYEARVNTEDKQVELLYYGQVVQKTGENWTGIALKLSTARPHIGGNPPELQPWYMEVYRPLPPASIVRSEGGTAGFKRKKASMQMPEEAEEMVMMMDEMSLGAAAEVMIEAKEKETTVESGQGASVVFSVTGGSDVPGDGSVSRHRVLGGKFASKFKYLSLPKLSELAYLTAEVENESEHPLLPGALNIFMDGNFVGKAGIKDLVTSEEKFELNLGVDESIRVKRKLLKKIGDEKGIFSKSKHINYAFLITVENLRNSVEEIVVRDQVPVSQDEKIKIEVNKTEPAENPAKDKEKLPNGTIEWKLLIEPKSIAKCQLAFSVEHPLDIKVREF